MALGAMGLSLFSACSNAGSGEGSTEASSTKAAPSADASTSKEATSSNNTDWIALQEGECPPNDSITVELSDGIPRRFAVVSAFAEPAITITSMQGATVATREGSGYTLYVADYALDPDDLGRNPEPDQAKLEFTFITQDHSMLGPGLYGKQKDNLAVGPNLFYGGKAYPMKNNFRGGVFVSAVDEDRFCGQIQLRSKYEVVIEGSFSATVVEARKSD
jgi:hypothetical protein